MSLFLNLASFRRPHNHNCRPQNLQLKLQNPINDACILSSGLDITRESLSYLNEKYIIDKNKSHHELIEELDRNSKNDKLIREIESGGDGSCEYDTLNWPKSLASSQYGDIIVCDSFNHRLLVFNKELVYKYSLGSLGNQPGQFNVPFDVEISYDNQLLIADSNNFRLQIYKEVMIFKQSTTKVNRYFHNISSPRVADNFSSSSLTPRSQTYQFKYLKLVEFKGKPIKIAKSRLSTLIAVSCSNGLVYVLDAQFIIISVAKLVGDFLDMRNVALSRQSELMMIKKKNDCLYLQFYEFKLDSLERLKMINPDKISQINNPIYLVKEAELERMYLPGVCVDQVMCMTTTPDTHNLLIFDVKNECLVEYDLNGNFNRILFRACDYLNQVLAVSFTPEGHFISLEYEIKRYKQSKSSSRPKTSVSVISKHIFKIKVRRYMDCDCHRFRPMVIKKRSMSQLRSLTNKSSIF